MYQTVLSVSCHMTDQLVSTASTTKILVREYRGDVPLQTCYVREQFRPAHYQTFQAALGGFLSAGRADTPFLHGMWTSTESRIGGGNAATLKSEG